MHRGDLPTGAGLYEQFELDGNRIIVNWPGALENFHVRAGFSGHGMLHASAAVRVDNDGDRSMGLATIGVRNSGGWDGFGVTGIS